MSITKCTNKDSLGRECLQYKSGERYCGYPECNHLATAYLTKPNQEVSDEAKRWLAKHNPELYEKIKDYY
jgi:hypothetical protein